MEKLYKITFILIYEDKEDEFEVSIKANSEKVKNHDDDYIDNLYDRAFGLIHLTRSEKESLLDHDVISIEEA